MVFEIFMLGFLMDVFYVRTTAIFNLDNHFCECRDKNSSEV